MISSQLELHRLNTGRQVRVVAAQRMVKQMLFRYQGHIGTYLIMGGVDVTGPALYEIAAHGSTSKVPFCTMGSGTLAAMSVLESHWKPDMEEEAAKKGERREKYSYKAGTTAVLTEQMRKVELGPRGEGVQWVVDSEEVRNLGTAMDTA